MKYISNQTKKAITEHEDDAIRHAAEILEEAFGKSIRHAIIRPLRDNEEEVYGVAFGFETNGGEETWK